MSAQGPSSLFTWWCSWIVFTGGEISTALRETIDRSLENFRIQAGNLFFFELDKDPKSCCSFNFQPKLLATAAARWSTCPSSLRNTCSNTRENEATSRAMTPHAGKLLIGQ